MTNVSGDDYLWDRSGEPDPDVQRLESLLRPLRSHQPAPEWAVARPAPRRPGRTWLPLAAAAGLVLAAAIGWTWTRAARDGWALARLEGTSWTDARVVNETRLALASGWTLAAAAPAWRWARLAKFNSSRAPARSSSTADAPRIVSRSPAA